MTSNPLKLYPNDLATSSKPGEPYRPSNGTEGDEFIDLWCRQCTRGAALISGKGDFCPIVDNAAAFHIGDPGYPKEWEHGQDGRPRCTAFHARGEMEKHRVLNGGEIAAIQHYLRTRTAQAALDEAASMHRRICLIPSEQYLLKLGLEPSKVGENIDGVYARDTAHFWTGR